MRRLRQSSVLNPRPVNIFVHRPAHYTGTRRTSRGDLLTVEEVTQSHVCIVIALEGRPAQVNVEVCTTEQKR